MKKINPEQIISKIKSKIRQVKITPAEIAVIAAVVVLSALIIVPSLVQCVVNRSRAQCSHHMDVMRRIISNELIDEAKTGKTYIQDLVRNGNYQKLLVTLSEKSGENDKFPTSDYYITTGEDKITIYCKKHKELTDKSVKFALMHNLDVEVKEKKQIGEKIAYLTVSGPDTYYENDILDKDDPSKMVYRGREIDKAINNLKVTAVYVGGFREELPRSRYTITTDKLNMKKSGQTHILIKSNSRSLWDDSAYAPFVIDVIGNDDVAPLIVDSGISGRFELAAWEWNDYVAEAAAEENGKEFGASIIGYNGSYYYYPDGLWISNNSSNDNPFEYAFDKDDYNKKAYSIEFDPLSVIITADDEKNIHTGSVRIQDDLVYIWQDTPSKDLDKGWIRVYCQLRKY